jgi:hypothetical protein
MKLKINKISIVLISLILLLNFAFSYEALMGGFYHKKFSGDITTEINSIFSNVHRDPNGLEFKEIGDLLAKEPNIEDKYIMSDRINFSFYSGAKFIDVEYHEGVKGNDLNDFISRENWSEFDRYFSDLYSFPQDRNGKIDRIPDYLIIDPNHQPRTFSWNEGSTSFNDLMILNDSDNDKIPSNFELFYKSEKTGTVVYKINHDEGN